MAAGAPTSVTTGPGPSGVRATWQRGRRVHVPVGGLRGPRADAVRDAVLRAVRALPSVDWAEVDEHLEQVVVIFTEGESGAGLADGVLDAFGEAEGQSDVPPGSGPRDHPARPDLLGRSVVGLAADVTGIGLALAGRALRLPPLPAPAAAVVATVEGAPRVRSAVERALGAARADLVLAASTAVVHGFAQQTLGLGVDALVRTWVAAEQVARRRAFSLREPELYPSPHVVLPEDDPRPAGGWHLLPGRPVPPPSGVAAAWADRLGVLSLGGAAVALGVSGRFDLPAAFLVAGIPKAARTAMIGYGTTLGTRLAGRGTVVLDGLPLLGLDRIDTVLVDGRLPAPTRAEVLAAARAARVEAVIGRGGARDAGEGSAATRTVPGGAQLADSVRLLQREGRVVAVVSGRASAALRAADLGVGVLGAGRAAPRAGHLVCLPGTGELDLLIAGVAAARRVALAGTVTTLVASAIGAVVAAAGPPGGAVGRASLAVNGGAVVGLGMGSLEGLLVSGTARSGRQAGPSPA